MISTISYHLPSGRPLYIRSSWRSGSEQLRFKPALRRLPPCFRSGTWTSRFFSAAARFGGHGFLYGGGWDWEHYTRDVLVGETRVGVSRHHILGLCKRQAAAEDGRKVIRMQGFTVLDAWNVKLR